MSSRNSSSVRSSYGAFDEDWPSDPPIGIRTPPPPFDLEAFAADSECRLRACAEAERKSTAPPPPYHPSVAPSEPRSAGDLAIAPVLLDCARRADLTRAQLRVGGLSSDEAARVLRAELARVRDAGATDALRVLASTLGAAFGELGGIAEEESMNAGTVLVLEDDVGVRDRLTLALEAIGHRVCSAGSTEALTELAAHEMVAVLVGVDAGGGSRVWEILRGLLPLEGVAIVLGGRGACPGLETLASEAGADDFVRFDLAIHELIEELGTIFVALGLTRPQALSA